MAQELILQTKILNDLRGFGKYCSCFKIVRCGENGIPDVFFTMRLTGAVFIEVKRPKEEPSTLQYLKLDKLSECGCKTFWCNTWKGWVEIKKQLGIHDRDKVADFHERCLL